MEDEPAELPVVAARRLHQTPAAELKEANTLQVLSTLLQNLALRPKKSPHTSSIYQISYMYSIYIQYMYIEYIYICIQCIMQQ